MKILLHVFLTLFAVESLGGCGTKGSLKTPTQMEQQEQKKAHKEAEAKKRAEEEKIPSPLEGEGGAERRVRGDNLNLNDGVLGTTPPPNLPPQGGEE